MTTCVVCGRLSESMVCLGCKERYTLAELDELVREALEPPPYDSPFTGESGELAEIKANQLAKSFTEFLKSESPDVLYIVDSEDGVIKFKADLCERVDCDLNVNNETVSNCAFNPDIHDPSDCVFTNECEHGLSGDCVECDYPGQVVESCTICGCGTWHKDGVCSLCRNDRNKVYEQDRHSCSLRSCVLNDEGICDYKKNRDNIRVCLA